MDGYWATGRTFIDTSPAMTMISETTVAKIGRSIKNRENMNRLAPLAVFSGCGGLRGARRSASGGRFRSRAALVGVRRDLDVRTQRQRAVHHDAVPGPK